MKIFVKTLKGTHFEIQVNPEDTVADVKKNIETIQGPDVYPVAQQMLIHQGKVLKDGTTLEENKVAENNFVVIMLTKNKSSSNEGSTTSTAPTTKAPQASAAPPTSTPVSAAPQPSATTLAPVYLSKLRFHLLPECMQVGRLQTLLLSLHFQFSQHLFLQVDPMQIQLDLFPQGLPDMGSNAAGGGNLDFLRNSQQFQALRAMMQANPQLLQPMLQELGKQNPHLMRLIQEHQADFVRLINEPIEGGEGNLLGQLASGMPQAITVTPEEREAIERLEAMGFDRAVVLEVFFACNKNEELAANYLLDHIQDFED
ncbi:hypothetical protein F0562_034022 [Nyssa sinensis]|uniref:Ubiquitin receptor RAD23 n=1 Tax=Nyssa sinensis TaxID=561372 RepID=A0A5J5AG59_9ASTE|nr:hypothetical protein F0562_034022 [Nyssa sinensis]